MEKDGTWSIRTPLWERVMEDLRWFAGSDANLPAVMRRIAADIEKEVAR